MVLYCLLPYPTAHLWPASAPSGRSVAPRPALLINLTWLSSLPSGVTTSAPSLLFRTPKNMPVRHRWTIFAALTHSPNGSNLLLYSLPRASSKVVRPSFLRPKPRDEVSCMIVSRERVSGADRYPVPELGCILMSNNSPDRSFNVSVGCVSSNGCFLWGSLDALPGRY